MAKRTTKRKDETTANRNVSQPALITYLPLKPNGSAVIICVGGGCAFEHIALESTRVAQAFNQWGVTAFVLAYRLPTGSDRLAESIGLLQDAQRAMKLVREKANAWQLDAHKIGLVGFSADGHLAATAATHFQTAYIPNPTGTDLRPDFLVLVYPVTSLTTLVAESPPTAERTSFFTNEREATEQFFPDWLAYTGSASAVPRTTSAALCPGPPGRRRPSETLRYPEEQRGFEWMEPLFGWMKRHSWLN